MQCSPVVRELSTNEWAVLGLLSSRTQNGFALAKSLSPGGDFGHVWTVRRPLVYRALETLRADGLIAFQATEPGDGGPPRRKTVITPRGKTVLIAWLGEPARHIRDARSLLLLKLVIIDDLGLDPKGLVESQLEVVRAIARGLELQASRTSEGSERTVLLFRLEMARGLERFLARRAAGAGGGKSSRARASGS